MKRKLLTVVALFALVAVGVFLYPAYKAIGQATGLVTVVGGVTPTNQFPQTVATGLAGAVTNPASNFIVQVAGGPIYFGGNIQTIGQSQLTLPASTTNLIVWNGTTEQMYSKQAVTGPGSSGTTVGVPTSLLFATPGVEIALATVVCNATACGNGGNGSITDNRPLSAFPAGLYIGGHLNQAAAGTTTGGAGTGTSAAGICTPTAATTCVVTFSQAYQNVPVCVVTDASNAIVNKALATTAALTITAASNSDTWEWVCVGNPN